MLSDPVFWTMHDFSDVVFFSSFFFLFDKKNLLLVGAVGSWPRFW